MTEQEISSLVVRRFAMAQSPLGLWRLNAYAAWKRLSWRWVLSGTVALKRTFDIIGSALFLLICSPVFLLTALFIRLDDGGPVFFVQTRVGKWGREFKMFKFRSMCVDAEQKFEKLKTLNRHAGGVTFKLTDDPRMTRVGRWLRRFSIDELPQFINVLKGDMSLVGPRPPLPREVRLYTPSDRRRLAATPGITCLWQIGGRSEIDFPGQVQLDVEYIESQSFWLDLCILVRTVPAVLSGKGAC